MSTVYMLVGIPGSGKSTFAKALKGIENIEIISSDHVRNLHPDWEEKDIFPEVYRLIYVQLKQNKNCIYDATNVTPKVRKRLFKEMSKYNIEFDVGVYYFPVSYEECYRRISLRNELENERYFPLEKLKHYFETIVEPTVEEGFIFVKTIK